MGDYWIPVAARLTQAQLRCCRVANVHDGQVGKEMVGELPSETRFVLGDQHRHKRNVLPHYRTDDMKSLCYLRGIELVATLGGKYPHTDAGAEVRKVFHQLRSHSIENFNEHFKTMQAQLRCCRFDSHCDVPTKGKAATTRFALSAVLVYQLGLWARHELGLPVNRGLKPFLRAT